MERRCASCSDKCLSSGQATISRFLSAGGFKGKTESAGDERFVPSEDEVVTLASSLVAAVRDDPQAFGAYAHIGGEGRIKELITGAATAIHIDGRDATLTEPQLNALEAIILLSGRPVLFIQNDSFLTPRGSWEILAAYGQEIRSVVKSVGRINVSAGAYMGTGFVVGEGLIMTNRHVVSPYVAKRGPASWEMDPNSGMSIDFKQEFGVAETAEFQVESVVWVDDEVDLAVLKLGLSPNAGCPAPAPLRLQKKAKYANIGNNVYVVGYPAKVKNDNDPAEMERIFDGVYEKKRLAPGKISSLDPGTVRMGHDCSTLGGNSGSCVVDLSTNTVLGLHFGGNYLKSNSAVLLPALASEDRLRDLSWFKEVNWREESDG